MTGAPPLRIFDGARLRATLFNPRGERLLVTLRQRIAEPGAFDEPGPVKTFLAKGYAHLHLQSRLNDWFINSETTALEDALSGLAPCYRAACAMGFSMGGYGALRFARCLGLTRVVLVSPQVSIHPGVVPWDARFRDCAAEFDPVAGDLGRVAVPALSGVVAFDPFRRADRLNARAIGALFPGLALCALGGGGHPATQIVRQGGAYGRLQMRLRDDRLSRQWLVRTHRRLRRDSPLYWERLEKRARAGGHPALAAAAGRVCREIAASEAE